MKRTRRLKLPVLSRLAWAWLAFATATGGALLYGAYDAGRGPAAIAMRIDGIETLTPPPHRTTEIASPERLAAGATAATLTSNHVNGDSSNEPFALDAEDALDAAADASMFAGDSSQDVVITIDGVPARAPGEAPPEKKSRSAARAVPIAAPDPQMLRKTAYGMAPRLGPQGRKPASYYARPFKPGEQPNVALIVGGLGLNRALTEKAIDELPPDITLAFAPYAKDLPFWSKKARDAGHEVMIELPMEDRAGDAQVLGPAALLTSRTAAENLLRLDWVLSRFEGYFGVTNYLGSKFSTDPAFDPVLNQLKASGIAYIDDTGAVRQSWHGEDGDIATVNRIVNPGFETDKSQTLSDLEALEKLARSNGDAIGKTYAHSATLDAIVAWAASLEEREIALAPASAVMGIRGGDR